MAPWFDRPLSRCRKSGPLRNDGKLEERLVNVDERSGDDTQPCHSHETPGRQIRACLIIHKKIFFRCVGCGSEKKALMRYLAEELKR